MSLQKQKDLLKNLVAKMPRSLGSWHGLHMAPVLIGVSAFALALYAQPVSLHTKTHPHTSVTGKSHARHVSVPRKTTRVTPAPKPVVTTPSVTPQPAPAKVSAHASASKTQPVVTPSPGSNVSGLAPTSTPPPSGGSQPPSTQTVSYTSTNWSGYLTTNGNFTAVSGSWTTTNPTGNGSTTSADSTWIGIGGVTADDLIQVGTQNIVAANGQVSTSAFYELLPDVSQPVSGVTVSTGDSMSASITEVSLNQWTITITDRTDGQSSSLTVTYVSSLSSAEWIEEDPSYSTGRQIPFDNFGGTSFSSATTVENGSTVTLGASGALPVTMVDGSGQSMAVPSSIGGDGASFTVAP